MLHNGELVRYFAGGVMEHQIKHERFEGERTLMRIHIGES
jgi:hypothetical protein